MAQINSNLSEGEIQAEQFKQEAAKYDAVHDANPEAFWKGMTEHYGPGIKEMYNKQLAENQAANEKERK